MSPTSDSGPGLSDSQCQLALQSDGVEKVTSILMQPEPKLTISDPVLSHSTVTGPRPRAAAARADHELP